MKSILFWIAVGIVAWFGLRHLFSILTGWSQDGPWKPYQRPCHVIAIIIYWMACAIAIYTHSWWPLLVGVVLAHLYRRYVIWTGEKFPLSEEEKQMSTKEFIKHIANERTNDKT